MSDAIFLRMNKAHENLAALPKLIDDEFYGIVVNRAYYAMFSAVQALFLINELHVKTHKGLHLKFGELYVQTGIFPIEMASALARIEDLRVEADYDFDSYITQDDALKATDDATSFVSSITEYLQTKGFLK